MEGCTSVSATSADTPPPQTTTTSHALAVPTAEATSTTITSTSSDMSLTTALESSCTLSDSSPADATLDTDATGNDDLQRPSPSSPFIDASAAGAPSCGGRCTGSSSSSSAAETGASVAPTMTTIDESPKTTSHNHNHNNTDNKSDKRKKKRKVVRIDIYSDTTCPWCYITKKRLEKAIHAFQLASSSSTSSDAATINADSTVDVHEGCSSNPHPPPSPVKPSAQSSSPDQSLFFTTPPTNTDLPPREEEIHFDIHWRPFQLDPQAPREPIRKSKMYHRKFGTEKALQIQDRVVAAGKAEGVVFSYTDQSLYSNTIDSHRLLRFARERLGRPPLGTTREEEDVVVEEEGRRKMVDSGNALNGSYHSQAQDQEGYFPAYTPADHQEESYFSYSDQEEEEEEEEEVDEWGARMEDAMVDELFRSHFERGECSQFETLKSCARSVLIQTAAFSALEELDLYLHSDEGLDEVMEEIRIAKEDLGMQGVPMIVIQNEYLLSGAQTTNTFAQVLQRVI
ncbi:MAG: hypothetical protein JOS17DRAFT_477009 [Linnemannia elongata]|nr:MAG: hypothetical protein JOS17DRAFT_477009 [Linnemannia elongata]